MNLKYIIFLNLTCLISFLNEINCETIKFGDGKYDDNYVKSFIERHGREHFLSKYPLETIRSYSYPLRNSNPFANANSYANDTKVATTQAIIYAGYERIGLIQFRQISDMWLVEVKGVLEKLKPDSFYLIAISEDKIPDNYSCNPITTRFNPFKPLELHLNLGADNISRAVVKYAGDVGIFYVNKEGVAYINHQSRVISLFTDSNSIINKSLGIFKLQHLQVFPFAEACGRIDSPFIGSVQYETDRIRPKKTFFVKLPGINRRLVGQTKLQQK